MSAVKKLSLTSGGIAVMIVAVLSINVIAAKIYGRIDVTDERIYSLSAGTEKILAGLTDDITAKLYFSRSMKELPVVIKDYATRVEEVLQEYSVKSGGKITVEVIDPKPDTDEEEWAGKYGLSGVRMPKGDQLFFGLVFIHGTKEIAIPYLDPRREEFLEYDLSEAIVGIFRKEKPRIGIMSTLSVMGRMDPMNPHGGGEAWVFVNDLKRNFDVVEVEPNATVIDSGLKALVVIHPKELGDPTLYAIDQFVVGGGRLIVAVDPMSRTDMTTSGAMMRQMGQMPKASSTLGKLFTAWNITFNDSEMVGDVGLATRINAGGMPVDYPYFMTIQGEGFSTKSVVTSNLKMMMIAEGGAISLAEGSKFTLEPLIETTGESGVGSAGMAGFMMPADLARELKIDKTKRIVAGHLRGKFVSAFSEPPKLPEQQEGSEAAKPGPHKAEADQEGSIIVIADTDFLADSNAVDKFQFGPQTMVRVRNDNLNFLFNAADFLGGSEDLISIRSRGRISRPFTKVAELQKVAHERWKAEEEKLTAELNDLQKKLNELQQQRTDGNRFVLTDEQQSEIVKFREREAEVKKQRRIVRKNLREDIETLGNRLLAANLLVVPLSVAGFGFGVFFRRNQRTRKEKANGK